MQQLGDLLKNIPAPPLQTARSFRESLINQFIEEILKGNKGTQWEPKTEAALARFKRGIAIRINTNPFLAQNWQLEGFYKMCKAGKSFGATFYSRLKTK